MIYVSYRYQLNQLERGKVLTTGAVLLSEGSEVQILSETVMISGNHQPEWLNDYPLIFMLFYLVVLYPVALIIVSHCAFLF